MIPTVLIYLTAKNTSWKVFSLPVLSKGGIYMDAEMALNNRRKSIVIKLALIFGAMIIFLTFFSKTINNTLLPVVDTVKVKKGSIGRTIEKTGQVELLNKENVYATGAWKVTDVFVKRMTVLRKAWYWPWWKRRIFH